MTTRAAVALEPPVFCPSCGHNWRAEQPVTIGGLSVDPRGDALWHGKRIDFTRAQFLVFSALAQAAGKLVTIDVLAERSGYDGSGDSRDVVQVLICRIRRHLRAVNCPPTIIPTPRPRGRGYAIDTALLLELEEAREC